MPASQPARAAEPEGSLLVESSLPEPICRGRVAAAAAGLALACKQPTRLSPSSWPRGHWKATAAVPATLASWFVCVRVRVLLFALGRFRREHSLKYPQSFLFLARAKAPIVAPSARLQAARLARSQQPAARQPSKMAAGAIANRWNGTSGPLIGRQG